MDTHHISDFLLKIKDNFFLKEKEYEIISDIISREIGFKITPSSIKIKNTNIKVSTSPLIKGEIMIHKEKILSEISEKITDKKFTTII